MQQAVFLAQLAGEAGEVPVGAIVVDSNGKAISAAQNYRERHHDPTAHAEVIALRLAGQYLHSWHLNNCTLYVTLEPCPMCTGGILFANIKKVVWLLNDEKGFGGYRKLKRANVFDERFKEVQLIIEPYEDLKERQIELMNKWASNPNNLVNLRELAK